MGRSDTTVGSFGAAGISTATEQEYIELTAIQPISYNVVMGEFFTAHPLPAKGRRLRIPRIVEMTEAAALSEITLITDATPEGQEKLQIVFDDYDVAKYGKQADISDQTYFASKLEMLDTLRRALVNSLSRSMNTRSFQAVVGTSGFQWMRQDANTTAEVQGVAATGSPTTTSVPSGRTEANDFWNNGQMTFTTGANAGISRLISDYALASGTFTVTAFPVAPAAADLFNICTVGTTASAVDAVAAGDVWTLPGLFRASERPRRYGAFGQSDGARPNAAGIMRDISGLIAQGVTIVPTPVAHDIKNSLASGQLLQAYAQTEMGFMRAVRGTVERIAGQLVVEANHWLRQATTNNAFSFSAGAAWPVVTMFADAAGTTTLLDNPGDRKGLVVDIWQPVQDMAVQYRSIKWHAEMYVLNQYFVMNSLHGVTNWVGTAIA